MKSTRSVAEAFALAVASSVATSVVLSNALPYLSGRLNRPGIELEVTVASLVCALILGALVLRLILVGEFVRSQRRIKLGLTVIAFSPLFFVFSRQNPFDVFVDGFARWAQANRHLGSSRIQLIANAATIAPTPLPMEWPQSEDSPSGIRIDVSKWPASFNMASVDDVWVFDNGLLLVWNNTIRRFVYYSSKGESPRELESPILSWRSIGSDLSVGVCYPH